MIIKIMINTKKLQKHNRKEAFIRLMTELARSINFITSGLEDKDIQRFKSTIEDNKGVTVGELEIKKK